MQQPAQCPETGLTVKTVVVSYYDCQNGDRPFYLPAGSKLFDRLDVTGPEDTDLKHHETVYRIRFGTPRQCLRAAARMAGVGLFLAS